MFSRLGTLGRSLTAAFNEPRDENERPDWVPRKDRARQTSQLLFLGALLAIVGLVLSLAMLIFNQNCSPKFRLGSAVNRDGRFEMCFEDYHGVKVAPGNAAVSMHLVVDVPPIGCMTNDDCREIPHGFCAGGPTKLRVENHCQYNDCICQTILPDCGLHTYFSWSYTASDYIPGCDAPACAKNHTISVPFWMFDASFAGCEYRRKTTLEDAQLWIQHSFEKSGLVMPLQSAESPKDEVVWRSLKAHLSRTPDVRFNAFWPSTISESVSDGFSPSGRIFLGFMLCAALCLLASNYTTEVETVDLPDKKIPIIGIQWNTLRNWLPPIGLIILSTVQMVPTSKIVDLPQALMTVVHLIGAQFCFLVYLICETAALLDRSNVSEMIGAEWAVRTVILVTGAAAMATFVFMYLFIFLFSGSEFTPYLLFPSDTAHSDLYKKSFSLQDVKILRAADGWWVWIKVISYTAEYMVAMAILVSHLCIWMYFERSRRVKFKRLKTMANA